MTSTEQITELQARVNANETLLRSTAAFLEAVASGMPMTDLRGMTAKVADKIRDHLNPRRGMAESRRGR